LEIAVVVARLGLGATMIRFVDRYIENDKYAKIKALTHFYLKTMFFSSAFIAAVVLLSADIIAERIFHKPDLASSLMIAILGLPFLSMTPVILSFFTELDS
jgi:O-antigen/teichoic acid export membrane protein